MPTRGEAQAALDAFIEANQNVTVTEYVAAGASTLNGLVANTMAEMFARLEVLSDDYQWQETAHALAVELSQVADIASKLADLAVGTAVELGGNDMKVVESPSWGDYVTEQQALVDDLPLTSDEIDELVAEADALADDEVYELQSNIDDEPGEEVSA